MRIPYISLIGAGALALGGCAYGDFGYGLGYGNGYGGYGAYGSPYYGSKYGNPYYGYSYGSPYYGSYGSYGSPYFGWYDDYYYPGTGYYVYDTYRRPRVWTSRQRSYWLSRQTAATTTKATNWSGFNRRSTTSSNTTVVERPRRRHRD